MRKILFSNFQNNEYDVMIERDVIFHARQVQLTSSKLTSCNSYISRRLLNLRFVTTLQTGITDLKKMCTFDVDHCSSAFIAHF